MAIAVIGISAGAAAYSAHKASSASHDAADTQAQSGRDAMGVQSQMYQQQQQNLSPYRDAGGAALNRLSQFQSFNGVPGRLGAGITPQAGDPNRDQRTAGEIASGQQFKAGMTGGVPPQPDSGFQQFRPIQTIAPQPMAPQGMASGAMAGPQGSGGGALMPPPGVPMGATPATAATQATGERLVTLKAPNGKIGQFPESQAQHYIQQGAQVVNA